MAMTIGEINKLKRCLVYYDRIDDLLFTCLNMEYNHHGTGSDESRHDAMKRAHDTAIKGIEIIKNILKTEADERNRQ